MSDDNPTPALVPVDRHSPVFIARVDELLLEGLTGKEIATEIGCARATVEKAITEHEHLGLSRARAKELLAERLIEEGEGYIDEPLHADAKMASAAVTRAKNRAQWRWDRAAAENRAKYGKAEVQASVQVNVQVAFVSLAGAARTDADDFVPKAREDQASE